MRVKTLILISILFILIIISLGFGRYKITLEEIKNAMFMVDSTSTAATLFYQIRLPRTILVILCGAVLSLAGLVYQNIFRNPLVSPDVLGVSTGCSLGAAIAIILIGKTTIVLQMFSFVLGIFGVLISMAIARVVGTNKLLALIISGIVVSSLASSGIMMLKYVADPYKELPSIEFWLMGGFYNADWHQIISILPILILGTLSIIIIRWQLKVLTLGDEQAFSLGVNVRGIRITAILSATFLVAAVVSVAGLVNWIGLLAPHIAKYYVEDEITKTIPLSMLSGAIILLIADIASRTLFSAEIPISILTSIIGAPFLAFLLYKRGRVI